MADPAPATAPATVPGNLQAYAQQLVGADLYQKVADAAAKANKPEILADFTLSVTAKDLGHPYIAKEAQDLLAAEMTAAKIDPALVDQVNGAIKAEKPVGVDNYLEMDRETAQYLDARANANKAKPDPAVSPRLLNAVASDANNRYNIDTQDAAYTAVKNAKSDQYKLVESGGAGAKAKADLDAKAPANTVTSDVRANFPVDPKLADLAKAMQQMGIAPATSTTLPSGGAKPVVPAGKTPG
jgi:hypothetical protein